jgi:hypothetical protein
VVVEGGEVTVEGTAAVLVTDVVPVVGADAADAVGVAPPAADADVTGVDGAAPGAGRSVEAADVGPPTAAAVVAGAAGGAPAASGPGAAPMAAVVEGEVTSEVGARRDAGATSSTLAW